MATQTRKPVKSVRAGMLKMLTPSKAKGGIAALQFLDGLRRAGYTIQLRKMRHPADAVRTKCYKDRCFKQVPGTGTSPDNQRRFTLSAAGREMREQVLFGSKA